jgi:hypothetical protein
MKALAAAPIAGRALASRAAGMSGMSMVGQAAQAEVFYTREGKDNWASPAMEKEGFVQRLGGKMLAAFLRSNGLPDWKRQQFRNYARSIRVIEPDLAALRSVSPGWMLRRQWARAEESMVQEFYRDLEGQNERGDYIEKNNLEWF